MTMPSSGAKVTCRSQMLVAHGLCQFFAFGAAFLVALAVTQLVAVEPVEDIQFTLIPPKGGCCGGDVFVEKWFGLSFFRKDSYIHEFKGCHLKRICISGGKATIKAGSVSHHFKSDGSRMIHVQSSGKNVEIVAFAQPNSAPVQPQPQIVHTIQISTGNSVQQQQSQGQQCSTVNCYIKYVLQTTSTGGKKKSGAGKSKKSGGTSKAAVKALKKVKATMKKDDKKFLKQIREMRKMMRGVKERVAKLVKEVSKVRAQGEKRVSRLQKALRQSKEQMKKKLASQRKRIDTQRRQIDKLKMDFLKNKRKIGAAIRKADQAKRGVDGVKSKVQGVQDKMRSLLSKVKTLSKTLRNKRKARRGGRRRKGARKGGRGRCGSGRRCRTTRRIITIPIPEPASAPASVAIQTAT